MTLIPVSPGSQEYRLVLVTIEGGLVYVDYEYPVERVDFALGRAQGQLEDLVDPQQHGWRLP